MTKTITLCGVLTTLALIFSYIERLIPFDVGAPGIKPGLSNLVVITALYLIGAKYAFGINIVRILMAGLLFGTVASCLYALSGGLLSFFIMCLLKKTRLFSIAGVSMGGGVFHNVGQLLMAALVIHNTKIIYYLPVLIVAGLIAGLAIGVVSYYLVQPLRPVLEGKYGNTPAC